MAPDLEEQQDIDFLATVMTHADIDLEELWLYFISIGGIAGKDDIGAYLSGLISLPRLERKLLRLPAGEMLADRYAPQY